MQKNNRFAKVGSHYKNFQVTKSIPIEEIKASLVELVHLPTGATVVHIANDDPENLFCMSFQTLPSSSNGVAHILEHTVLCGSKKFPVKDPFFSMTRRSVNTFMNALTGSDFTCYPAASQIEKDFYNLLEIYLDAVFNPLLREVSFLQEGHRFAFEGDDPKNPLMYKGVVFNEMKGAMSSPDDRLWHKMLEQLFFDLPYRHNSGGDPKEIVNLTWEELREFHKYYYHPSHCLFFFYGNFPLEKHLDFIEKHALHNIEKRDLLPPLTTQSRLSSPIKLSAHYPISKDESEEKKTLHAFGFLTCPISDQDTALALALIDSVLADTDASPLKYALLQSGLTSQVEVVLDQEMSELPWVVVCKGCDKDSREKLYKVIVDALNNLASQGIRKELIESSLHQLEFDRMEIASNFGPYGLQLFMRAALLQQQGADAETALEIHSRFAKLNKNLENSNYLPSLIKKYFQNNTHQIHLTMLPDKQLNDTEDKEEKTILKAIEATLSLDDKNKILANAKRVQEYQMDKQSVECLPIIGIDDIPKTIKDYPLEKASYNQLDVYAHDCFTNNILYIDLLIPLPQLAEADLGLLTFFTSIFTEMGTKKRSYQDLLQETQLYLGSAESYLSSNSQVDNPNQCLFNFGLRMKALYRNTDHLFSLMQELIKEVSFDDKARLKELLVQSYTILENSVASNAMRYANTLSQSEYSLKNYLENACHGLPYFHFIKNLMKQIDDLDPLIADLYRIKDLVLSSQKKDLVIGCDQKQFEHVKKHYLNTFDPYNDTPFTPWKDAYKVKSVKDQARVIAAPISFTSYSFKSIPYTHPEAPYLHISSELMENLYLHKTIREQGGAYGSGARYNAAGGSFFFYSYRDPNILRSIAAFSGAINHLVEKGFTDQDLLEAKLGIIQGIESPISPGARALVGYNWLKTNRTCELRQQFKQKVLSASKQDIEKTIQSQLQNKKGVVITFAGRQLIEQEQKKGLKISDILSVS